jgi:hypothetical protein
MASDHCDANRGVAGHGHRSQSNDDRMFVVDNHGRYMPPCGHGDEYGCGKFCRAIGARDMGEYR